MKKIVCLNRDSTLQMFCQQSHLNQRHQNKNWGKRCSVMLQKKWWYPLKSSTKTEVRHTYSTFHSWNGRSWIKMSFPFLLVMYFFYVICSFRKIKKYGTAALWCSTMTVCYCCLSYIHSFYFHPVCEKMFHLVIFTALLPEKCVCCRSKYGCVENKTFLDIISELG